jgi:hypothetical protein
MGVFLVIGGGAQVRLGRCWVNNTSTRPNVTAAVYKPRLAPIDIAYHCPTIDTPDCHSSLLSPPSPPFTEIRATIPRRVHIEHLDALAFQTDACRRRSPGEPRSVPHLGHNSWGTAIKGSKHGRTGTANAVSVLVQSRVLVGWRGEFAWKQTLCCSLQYP